MNVKKNNPWEEIMNARREDGGSEGKSEGRTERWAVNQKKESRMEGKR